MNNQFGGKVSLVTRGSFGTGGATAIVFAEQGAKVVVANLGEDQETVDHIRALGQEVVFIQCDFSNAKEVKAMVDKVPQPLGPFAFRV